MSAIKLGLSQPENRTPTLFFQWPKIHPTGTFVISALRHWCCCRSHFFSPQWYRYFRRSVPSVSLTTNLPPRGGDPIASGSGNRVNPSLGGRVVRTPPAAPGLEGGWGGGGVRLPYTSNPGGVFWGELVPNPYRGWVH